VNEGKILAIVFEVAAHAVPAVGILHSEKRVVALMRSQTVRNFLVAFEAFECRRAGSKLVTGVALGRAVQGLVRFRERSGRNLSAGAGSHEQKSAENEQTDEESAHRRRDDPDAMTRGFCTEKRHLPPPTNRSSRVNRRQPGPKLACAKFPQTNEPTSCAFPAKLA